MGFDNSLSTNFIFPKKFSVSSIVLDRNLFFHHDFILDVKYFRIPNILDALLTNNLKKFLLHIEGSEAMDKLYSERLFLDQKDFW